MDWQMAVVACAVVAAAAYLARRWYRMWFKSKQGAACAGCGCGNEPETRSKHSSRV